VKIWLWLFVHRSLHLVEDSVLASVLQQQMIFMVDGRVENCTVVVIRFGIFGQKELAKRCHLGSSLVDKTTAQRCMLEVDQ